MRTVKIGLCGFTVAIGSYASRWPVVEVQQTFYQPSTDAVMKRWRATMPAGFEFTIKAWQLITHTSTSPTYRRLRRELTEEERAGAGAFRDSKIVEEAWQTTLHCAKLLDATSILFQCPASFRPTEENVANLEAFFRRIDRPRNVGLLWEPRGEWSPTLLKRLCETHDLVHAVDPFVMPTVTRGLTYYRLHGISGARHVYSDDELKQLREMIPKRGETYVMFNNIPRADDAMRFEQLLG